MTKYGYRFLVERKSLEYEKLVDTTSLIRGGDKDGQLDGGNSEAV